MPMNPRLMRPLARRQAPAPAFSPLSLTGLKLWLDATDSSSITLNGGNVSEWADKSPEGNDATQGVAAEQPLYQSNSINGLSAVVFDGSDDFLDALIPGLADSTSHYVACVFTPVSKPADYNPTIGVLSSAEDYGAMHFVKQSGSAASYPYYFTNTSANYDGNGSYANGQQAILRFQLADDEMAVYKDGSLEGSASFEGAPGEFVTGLRLAGQVTPPRRSNTKIGEMIVAFNPSAGDAQKAEGYLAHRWGLASALPAGHPYKDAAP